jgi:hypothetical protein
MLTAVSNGYALSINILPIYCRCSVQANNLLTVRFLGMLTGSCFFLLKCTVMVLVLLFCCWHWSLVYTVILYVAGCALLFCKQGSLWCCQDSKNPLAGPSCSAEVLTHAVLLGVLFNDVGIAVRGYYE